MLIGKLSNESVTSQQKQMTSNKPLLILVAGPYRSGTNDDPVLIAANVKAMTDTALELYEMGHMPVLGEWLALPLAEAAGSKETGDEIFNRIFHPSAVRLIYHCDAVLRIGGSSAGADEMVNTGIANSKLIFRNKSEIPRLTGAGQENASSPDSAL
jgi:hypothetical protein